VPASPCVSTQRECGDGSGRKLFRLLATLSSETHRRADAISLAIERQHWTLAISPVYDQRVLKEKKSSVSSREEFVREAMAHIDYLYRIALHLVREANEAQDLVQETYARALDARDRFTAGSNLKAWLTKILYNFFYDQYHQKKRWVSLETLSSDEEVSDYSDPMAAENPGPERQLLLKELSGKITEVLRRIPEEFRLPIVLVDMGDFSYAEACEILACPLGTVRSRISRGRKLLYKHLKEYVRVEEARREKQ
jgi:RNA polymerase sigma-70 factor, ECF subfamily